MSLASVMRSEDRLLVPTYDRHKILLERGRGVYLWDASGHRYLDFLSGIGVNALGYGHPAIQAVLKRQAGRLIHVSNLFFHEYQAELAKRLTGLSGLDQVFFCNSGTEAWEGALKFARLLHADPAQAVSPGHGGSKSRLHTSENGHKKWRILALENSFHGRTFGSLATTGQSKYRDPFAPLLPGVGFVRFNDVKDLERKFDNSICAICIETIQGEGGIRPVSAEFLKLARRLTQQTGALLLLDEIQCGLGRTGRYFAFQHYGIKPDIVTIAKPLAAGLPLGAILTTKRVAGVMRRGLHGTTFGGGPLACAVAIQFLRTLDGLLGHIREMGEVFRQELAALQARHECIREVRGMGLMLGMELDTGDRAKSVVAELLRRGIIINRTHETVLRFLPPYIVEEKHIQQVVRALDKALFVTEKQHSAQKSRQGVKK